ncbi:MAG: hypothetical protein K6T86_04110 [Pirellulales bacterium]|nr:hypothetical protein [Pirellulales bacterium]
MRFEELIVLLPCHSLEDFPTYQEGEEALGLLAAWTALWHPALLASAGSLPTWYRADGPPAELSGRLVVVPSASERLLLAGWTSRAADAGACVVRKCTTRGEILRTALRQLDGGDAYLARDVSASASDGEAAGLQAAPVRHPAAELVPDFLALGYTYLMVELLTRQMRYMSNLDEVQLRNEAVAAARCFVQGEADACRDHLRACYQVLLEARERFYPVEAYLVDLTLVAATTLGDSLRSELEQDIPMNVLCAAEQLEEMEREAPRTLAALRQACDEGRVSLVGGEYAEEPLALAPCEGMLAGFLRGLAVHERVVGRRPVVFGRRRHGLHPLLPQILSRLGFVGALHFTLDEGHFPHAGQSKIRWQGLDASAIDAVLRVAADASRVETFLSLARKMGETMDRDHVAVLLLAHWPGQYSPFLADLRRMARYAPVLGRFVTLEEFFTRTDRPGELVRFRADQYRAPYLYQAVVREEADPISRLLDWHRRAAEDQAAQTLRSLAELLAGRTTGQPAGPSSQAPADMPLAIAACPGPYPPAAARDGLQQAAETLARMICQGSNSSGGWLVLNPTSFSTICGVELPPGNQLAEGAPVAAVQTGPESTRVAVEVPALGFAWLESGQGPGRPQKKRVRPMAEGRIIRNDLLELEIHPETGGIRALHDFAFRGNRLSQQLALRLPGPRPKPGEPWRDPDTNAVYSHMVADAVECTSAGPALGEIISRGRLLDAEGQCQASFVQKVQLWRGIPYALLEIELHPNQEPRADPWNSYYAARFAWAEEEAELYASVGLAAQSTTARRIEAPAYIEIRAPRAGCTILTGGLPYHRRIGSRMLDSLLIVKGESRRRFRLGLAADLKHPAQQALHLMQRFPVVGNVPCPASGRTGWLFHIDARNVVATSWAPLLESGIVRGFRARLLEVGGRPGRVLLRSLRRPETARQVDFLNAPLIDLAVEDDRVVLDMGAYEWVCVEVRWSS